jgi:PAS domain S-box-containing protein
LKLFLTFVFLLLTTASIVHAQFLSYQNFNHKDGLNIASVNCIAQTKDGYIWLGTDGAELVRFDGHSFEEMHFKKGEDQHHYSNFSMDGENILFSSLYKGFFSFSRKNNSVVKLDEEKVNFGESIGVYRKDSIYYFIGTRGINYRKENVYGNLFTKIDTQEDIQIHHSIETNHSVILFTNQGAFKLSNGKITTLSSLLSISSKTLSSFNFGYIENKQLFLYNNVLNQVIVSEIDENDNLSNPSIRRLTNTFDTNKTIVSFSYNHRLKKGVALNDDGEIFHVNGFQVKSITHNYHSTLIGATNILTDFNGDFWVTSRSKGLFKISNELFTKIQFNPLFEAPYIYTIYQTKNKDFLLSNDKKTTFIGQLKNQSEFKEAPFSLNGVAEFEGNYLLATGSGVMIFDSKSKTYSPKYFTGKSINLVFVHGKTIYVGIAAEGLFRINTVTNSIEHIESPDESGFFYTAQVNSKNNNLFFGTNSGIFRLTPNSKKVVSIAFDTKRFGGYSGVSTKDKFGTCWFTLEKGILGITSSGETVEIYGSKYLNTNLFYTLNSDLQGNIVIGTNKGIIIHKVNKNGKVLNTNFYSGSDGFLGYETNMRSQFQSGNLIYVGTVEGLFQINTGKLNDRAIPTPPVILQSSKESLTKALGSNSISFTLKTNNSKLKKIEYVYRVIGSSEDWVKTNDANLILNELGNGSYTLEVKSTFDGRNYSEVSSFKFEINSPFWQSNWFLIMLIASIIVVNVLIVVYYRSHESSSLINTKDIDVHLQMAPTIILFGAIITPIAILFAPISDPSLEYHFEVAFILGFILLSLYFLSISARTNRKEHLFDLYLKAGLTCVLAVFLLETYSSSLNPYFIFGILLTSTLAPYIFNQIRLTIALAVAIFVISFGITLMLNTTVYPKMYFLTAIFIMGSLIVFSSYMRFDSLEKLIFISGIINKGNVPAIAFNKDGIITYASENISRFVTITHNELINSNVSVLNQFIPQGVETSPRDITKEFQDGEKYLVPMTNSLGKIQWIEWAYKDFSKDIKVILGQDVSEKVELENTYELLVQSAEDFIYRCDVDGNYVFVNNVSFQKLGYSKEELIGQNSIKLVHEDYRDEIKQYYRDHLGSQRHSSYKELPITKKNGEILWVGQSLTTIFSVGSNRQVIGFIALARDITDIRAQQEIIREQRDSITSSINYARRIQYNLLPNENLFKAHFKEHFIISKPKDIVSGDFYWMKQIEDYTVLVVADCTGHGVPGSFMTLLGFNLLNSIVLEGRTIVPSKILNELDHKLIEYLPKGKGETTVNDGMEVTICVFNNKTNNMSYACAGSRFLAIENGDFTMFKGDNKHIGDIEDDFLGYNTYFKEFHNDFNLFLFSDGFQDQFGGPKDKKYSFRRLIELFEANINLPLTEQGRIIEADFENWIGDKEQTDDVTILSVTRKIINFDDNEDLS